MKIKSHKFKSAMALCAVAFLSFTTAGFAKPRASFAEILDQGKQPAPVSEQPALPVDERFVAPTGTSTGTVSVD